MKKIIIFTVCVIAVLAGSIIFWIFINQNNSQSTTGQYGTLPTQSTGGMLPTTASDTIFIQGNSFADITKTLPLNVPQGDTITLQGTQGVVSMKNFYKSVFGYWPEMDALVIEHNTSWTIWYYRSDSSFGIQLAPSATAVDQSSAETSLLSDLGINQQAACTLSISIEIPIDYGVDYESTPLSFCTSGGAFQTM